MYKIKKVVICVLAVALVIVFVRRATRAGLSVIVEAVKNEINSENMSDKGVQEDAEDEIQNQSIFKTGVTDDEASSICLINNVPHIYQGYNYPTGCESVAAVSLMQYYGMNITVDEFIDNYLPQTDTPEYVDGCLRGESPWYYFLGDPRSENGYGCYSTVIENAMNSFCGDTYDINTIYDMSLEELAKAYVANGIPVMVWATMYMEEAREGDSWELPSGEIFTFTRPEHALILIGYDEENYYFSDSLDESSVSSYSREACEAAFAAMGNQAIVILPFL